MDRTDRLECRRKCTSAWERWLFGIVVCCVCLSLRPAQAAEELLNSDSEVLVPPAPAVLNTSGESEVADLTKRVAELEKTLKSRRDVETKPTLATIGEKTPTSTAIDLNDKKWTVKFGGHVQSSCRQPRLC